jgi:hypothetical protein
MLGSPAVSEAQNKGEISETVFVAAPSTMLRMVPLPRFAVAEHRLRIR